MTLLVVIDFQERIARYIEEIDKIIKNTAKLIKAFEIFGLPVIYTRQVKLGKVIFGTEAIEKETFSCWHEKKFRDKIKEYDGRDIIICGIETHICVLQTAIDMKNNGYNVEAAVDCVGSRNKEHSIIAIERMKQEGIKITSSEAVIYQIMKTSNSPHFKKILKIVKE